MVLNFALPHYLCLLLAMPSCLPCRPVIYRVLVFHVASSLSIGKVCGYCLPSISSLLPATKPPHPLSPPPPLLLPVTNYSYSILILWILQADQFRTLLHWARGRASKQIHRYTHWSWGLREALSSFLRDMDTEAQLCLKPHPRQWEKGMRPRGRDTKENRWGVQMTLKKSQRLEPALASLGTWINQGELDLGHLQLQQS